jgi:glutamate 5-kinase
VALLVRADWLCLMTDVSALYTANPNSDPDAQPIHDVDDVARLHVDTSTRGTQWGTGGMATKLTAARMATAAGCSMVICHFGDPGACLRIMQGERSGTVFHAQPCPVK